jgi:sugar lactone lactonase YvrE
MLRSVASALRYSIPLIAVLNLCPRLGSEIQSPHSAIPGDSQALNTSINGPTQLAFDDKSGSLYIVEWVGQRVLRLNIHAASIQVIVPKPDKESQDAFDFPQAIATNAEGDLYIADFNGRLRKIRADSGETDLILASPPNPLGRWALAEQIAVDPESYLLIADQMEDKIIRLGSDGANPQTVAGTARGFSGDGGVATQARLMFPSGVAISRNGDILIADYQNCRIRKVDKATGIITTIAGTGDCKSGGDGLPAIQATVNYPSAMTADSKGNLFLVEGGRIRKIDAAGVISTYAGTGESGFSGDGGPADKAKLNCPSGLTVDSDGNLYIAEFVNNRIRRVDAVTHTISTVAGDGGPERVDIYL